MLNPTKLKLFVKAVILKVKAGEDLDEVINSYTKLSQEEKEQLREAVEKELHPDAPVE